MCRRERLLFGVALLLRGQAPEFFQARARVGLGAGVGGSLRRSQPHLLSGLVEDHPLDLGGLLRVVRLELGELLGGVVAHDGGHVGVVALHEARAFQPGRFRRASAHTGQLLGHIQPDTVPVCGLAIDRREFEEGFGRGGFGGLALPLGPRRLDQSFVLNLLQLLRIRRRVALSLSRMRDAILVACRDIGITKLPYRQRALRVIDINREPRRRLLACRDWSGFSPHPDEIPHPIVFGDLLRALPLILVRHPWSTNHLHHARTIEQRSRLRCICQRLQPARLSWDSE